MRICQGTQAMDTYSHPSAFRKKEKEKKEAAFNFITTPLNICLLLNR